MSDIEVPRQVMKFARGVAIAPIEWEVGPGEGETYSALCEEFGGDVMAEAMSRIVTQISRGGYLHYDVPEEQRFT